MSLYEQVSLYSTPFQEEKVSQATILDFLRQDGPHCCRSNTTGHITASAFLLNRYGSHFLVMHHRKLNQWFQPGGHLEPNESPLEGAIREAMEESGISEISPVVTDIYDLDVHYIPENSHESAHFHYDIRFLLQTFRDDFQSNDESNELRWINCHDDTYTGIHLAPSITRMITKFKNSSFSRPLTQL